MVATEVEEVDLIETPLEREMQVDLVEKTRKETDQFVVENSYLLLEGPSTDDQEDSIDLLQVRVEALLEERGHTREPLLLLRRRSVMAQFEAGNSLHLHLHLPPADSREGQSRAVRVLAVPAKKDHGLVKVLYLLFRVEARLVVSDLVQDRSATERVRFPSTTF